MFPRYCGTSSNKNLWPYGKYVYGIKYRVFYSQIAEFLYEISIYFVNIKGNKIFKNR